MYTITETPTVNLIIIIIYCDGVFSGSGKLVDGCHIEDCAARFCDDEDESLEVYEIIEDAVASGESSVQVSFSDSDTIHEFSWLLTH